MVKIDGLNSAMNEKEITTYIQQQMVELAPHLEEKSALQVKLMKLQVGFQVELTVAHPMGEIQTVGSDEDIFQAIRNAKEGLLQYCVEVEHELNPQGRDEKINLIARNGNIYLH